LCAEEGPGKPRSPPPPSPQSSLSPVKDNAGPASEEDARPLADEKVVVDASDDEWEPDEHLNKKIKKMEEEKVSSSMGREVDDHDLCGPWK